MMKFYCSIFFTIFFIALIKDFSFASSKGKGKKALLIHKILIRGHDKIEEAAIQNKLISQVGQAYHLEKIKKEVKLLFETGYFYDVLVDKRQSKKGIILTYTLKEKPSIVSVIYKGNFNLKEEDITQASEVKAYEILDRLKLKKALKKIKNLYEEKGYFLAEADFKVEPIPSQKNSVKVTFNILENEQVQVKKITFLGNKVISSEKLKMVMFTKEDSFFSFIRKDQSYKQEVFKRDIQVLTYLYHNEGYVQVAVSRPEVYITPDKKSIYITLHIKEGDRFKIGKVKFTGDLLFTKERLQRLTKIKSGEYFSYQKLQDDLKILQSAYGDLGYAFVNPIPLTVIREKGKKVDLNFKIEKGNKVYINEINIIGNMKTRDKVIRRELKIKEGELYHETRRKLSLANIKRLGYFEEVDFLNETSLKTPDLVDIDIRVKERTNTGTLQFGLGYEPYRGVMIDGQLSQDNFLGYGHIVNFKVKLFRSEQFANLKFLDYYFLDSNWEFGVNFYFSKSTHLYYDGDEERYGSSVQVGYPIFDYWQTSFIYKLEQSRLVWDRIWRQSNIFLFEGGVTSSLTSVLTYDKRNDRFMPTDGAFFQNSLELSGLGGSLRFVKGLSTFRFFKPLFWRFVWRNNMNYGFITYNKEEKNKYFIEMFRLGGMDNLRGYRYYSIGETQLKTERVRYNNLEEEEILGSDQMFYYQTEMQVTLVKENHIYGVLFYDIGSAHSRLNRNSFYHDVGFGFRILTPIAPLRLEWAFPLKKPPYEDEGRSSFNFTIGPSF